MPRRQLSKQKNGAFVSFYRPLRSTWLAWQTTIRCASGCPPADITRTPGRETTGGSLTCSIETPRALSRERSISRAEGAPELIAQTAVYEMDISARVVEDIAGVDV